MEPELPRFWDSMSFSVCSSTPSCRESSLVCSTDRVCRALTTSTSDRAVDVAITPVTVSDRTGQATMSGGIWDHVKYMDHARNTIGEAIT